MESAQNSQGSVEPPAPDGPTTPGRERAASPKITIGNDSIWQAFEDSDNLRDDDTQPDDTTGTLGTPVQSSTPKRRRNERLFPRALSPARDELFPRPRSPARSPKLAPTEFLAREHDLTINTRVVDHTSTEETIFNPISLAVQPSESGARTLSALEVSLIIIDFRKAYALLDSYKHRIRQLTIDNDILRDRIAEDDARFLAFEAGQRTLERSISGHLERLRHYQDTERRSEELIKTMEQEIGDLDRQSDEATRGRETERRAKEAMTVRFQEELQRGEQAAQRETAAADALRLAQADAAHLTQQLTDSRAIVIERDAGIMVLRYELDTATTELDNLQRELIAANDDIGTLSGTGAGTGAGTGRARGVIATLQGNRPPAVSLGDQLRGSGAGSPQNDSEDEDEDEDEDEVKEEEEEEDQEDQEDQEDEDQDQDDDEADDEDDELDDNDRPLRDFRFVHNVIRNWPAERFVGDWIREFPELLMHWTPRISEKVEETSETTQTNPPVTIASGLLRGGWMNVGGSGGSGNTTSNNGEYHPGTI